MSRIRVIEGVRQRHTVPHGTNVIDMAGKLAKSQMAQYCFTQQYAEFAFGRSVSLDQEPCTGKTMGDYVTQKGGQVRQLLVSFAASPAVYRRIHQ